MDYQALDMYIKLPFLQLAMFLSVGYCSEVNCTMDAECYDIGRSMTITAVYTGTGAISSVRWYYSTATTYLEVLTDCTLFGNFPSGFPKNVTYKCPSTNALPVKTYELVVYGLTLDDLNKNIMGATFAVTGGTGTPTPERIRPYRCTTVTEVQVENKTLAIIVGCTVSVGALIIGGFTSAIIILKCVQPTYGHK